MYLRRPSGFIRVWDVGYSLHVTTLAAAAARGGASTVFFQLIRMVIGLATTIVTARLLSPDDFGLFAMIVAIVGFAEIVRDFGFSNAAVQARTLSHAQKSNLFWINVLIGLTIGAVLVLSAPAIAAFYRQPELEPLAQALAAVFVINGASAQFKAALVREFKILRVNIAETLAQLVAALAAVVVAIMGAGAWALVAQQFANAITGLILVVIFARWLPGAPARAPMGALLRYGGALTGQLALNYAVRSVDKIALGRVYGSTSLGYYDRAYQLLMIPIGQFNAPLTRVAVPTLSRVWNSDGEFERYLHTAQKVAAFVTVPIFAVLAGLGQPGVMILFGERWQFAGLILQILAVGGIFRSLMQISYWAYLSSGRTGVMLRFDLIALPCLALVILSGLPWGAVGVAVGHSIGYALYWFAGLTWMTRKHDLVLRPFLTTAARSVLLVAVPVVGSGLAAQSLIENLWLCAAVGVAMGIAAVGLLAVLIPSLRRDYQAVGRIARLALKR